MALTEIEYGSLASSEVMNNNFQYLDNRISTVAENLVSANAGTSSNIASINSTISSMSEEINSNLDDINTGIEDITSNLCETGLLYVETYQNESSWYKEYFSDSEKKNRVWLEQGGICYSRSTTTYLKSFSTANYTLVLGTHNCNYEHGGISSKLASGFSHYDGKGWGYDVDWYACGK